MNFSTIVGLIACTAVLVSSILYSLSNAAALLDFRSFLIVIGGTAAASLVFIPFKDIFVFIRITMIRVFIGSRYKDTEIIDQVVELSKASRKGRKMLERQIEQTKNKFVKDCGESLLWLETNVNEEELKDLLLTMADGYLQKSLKQANLLRTIAKFPPAFGLMGTTMGMISLFQKMGGAGGTSQLGAAMSIALLTTLYGLAFTNFFLLPLAECLNSQAENEDEMRRMIVEGVILVNQNKPTRYIELKLKSFIARGGAAGTQGAAENGTRAA